MPPWLQLTKFVLDFLSATAWPLAIFGAAWLLKEELIKLLSRVRKASFSSIEFQAPEPERDLSSLDGENVTDNSKSVSQDDYCPPFIYDLWQQLREEVKEVDDKTAILKLSKALAFDRVEKHFYEIYGKIFGSQINALHQIAKHSPVSRGDALDFFSSLRLKERYPETYEGNGFEIWVKFLLTAGLVKETANTFEITDKGREFLRWLELTRQRQDKLL